jgi:hypothetical protein
MSLKGLECQASQSVSSDMRPRPAAKGYWDDWLREPANRRGRACIRPEVSLGLGRILALYYHSFTFSRFTNIFGASISETTMRPNPRSAAPTPSARRARRRSVGAGPGAPSEI